MNDDFLNIIADEKTSANAVDSDFLNLISQAFERDSRRYDKTFYDDREVL